MSSWKWKWMNNTPARRAFVIVCAVPMLLIMIVLKIAEAALETWVQWEEGWG